MFFMNFNIELYSLYMHVLPVLLELERRNKLICKEIEPYNASKICFLASLNKLPVFSGTD